MNLKTFINNQISHCLTAHGDDPAKFAEQLEKLMYGWYKTGQNGIEIKCPHCRSITRVQYIEWSEWPCNICHKPIKIDESIIARQLK